MITSLYMAISFIHYFLGAIPEYRLQRDAPAYRVESENQQFGERTMRSMRSIGKWVFWAETANFAVCFVFLLLKCIGVLSWW